MNLRSRALLILGLTFAVFLLLLTVVMFSATLSGYERMENEDLKDAFVQTRSAIHAESATLLGTAQDWGWWDEMYEYESSRDSTFISRNADPDTMATVGVQLLMVFDPDGNLVYGRILSPDFESDNPVPEDVQAAVRNTPRLLNLPAGDQGIAGLLGMPGGPMIVAATPILHSDKSGPSRGTLVMGRYFAHGPLQRISGITGYRITLGAEDGAGTGMDNTPALPVASPAPSGAEGMTVVRNESTITGYSLQKDLEGQDLILGISMERTLYRVGNSNIATYLVLFFLWAAVTMLVVLVVIDRVVLRRIGILADHIRSLSKKPGGVPRPALTGGDELAELEQTIIRSRDDLLIREQQLRVFVNAMPGPAALFSRQGKILLVNPAFAGFFGKRAEEITGTDYHTVIPPDAIGQYQRFVKEAIRTKETIHFESERGGRTFLLSYYPVLGNDGEVAQIGLLAFDISERKRLENALQRLTKKIALLNTVILSDIQNKVFVQTGYLELSKKATTDARLLEYLEKEVAVVREIQAVLQFARQYNDMGMSPPRWQNVMEVMLFAISHLDLGPLRRDFRLEGLAIYADSLLERVFITLVENAIRHASGATVIRAGYSIEGDDAVIVVEDDGPGIAEDRRQQIFEKSTGSGGTGSLFLSREILSVTGITIRETGIAGKGARFEIRVPKGSYRFAGK
jgi:PAS domain S-box-containing protein